MLLDNQPVVIQAISNFPAAITAAAITRQSAGQCMQIQTCLPEVQVLQSTMIPVILIDGMTRAIRITSEALVHCSAMATIHCYVAVASLIRNAIFVSVHIYVAIPTCTVAAFPLVWDAAFNASVKGALLPSKVLPIPDVAYLHLRNCPHSHSLRCFAPAKASDQHVLQCIFFRQSTLHSRGSLSCSVWLVHAP